jgi:hypothetical protein
MFVLVALGMGRFELAREQVVSAARAAAEAASVVPSAGDAQSAAVTAATPVLENQGHSCQQLSVKADTTQFVPGGSVRVVVSCRIDFSDVLVPGLPGQAEIQAVASAPIDPFRSVQ